MLALPMAANIPERGDSLEIYQTDIVNESNKTDIGKM
jgi:hypothetical protein